MNQEALEVSDALERYHREAPALLTRCAWFKLLPLPPRKDDQPILEVRCAGKCAILPSGAGESVSSAVACFPEGVMMCPSAWSDGEAGTAKRPLFAESSPKTA